MESGSRESGKMALDTWRLYHGGTTLCDHMVSPKGLSRDMLHATCRLRLAICYRNKTLSLRDRCYCPYELVIFFRLTGSKCFPYAGWWRERKRDREGVNHSLRKRPVLLRVTPPPLHEGS
jgi:hypothetical protein